MSVHFLSHDLTWATPQGVFDELNKEFGFTLDPCCSKETTKCKKYYTLQNNGLLHSWEGERIFMNPPYGRQIPKWIEKAYTESKKGMTIVVCLIPSRTDTKWWHDYVMKANEIRFIKGRLKFGNSKNNAPFPSAIVVFN